MFSSPLKLEAWFSFSILGGKGAVKGKIMIFQWLTVITTHDFFFNQNTQKSNFHSALQLLAAYFCINTINLSSNLHVSLQVYFSLEQKSPKVCLAAKTKPTA